MLIVPGLQLINMLVQRVIYHPSM
ncbi:uncharacterized protein METZ01_LOCUS275529 [marine metagenome]|uniref:Uncharacterized protein n=1 Tax=marine metagenome TaxID=408172 RepID=A0A382KGE8_9ZZZZ